MFRYIDSLYKLYNLYYNKLSNNLNEYYRIEYVNYKDENNSKYLYNIISAFNNDYVYDNYCCSCLNPKQNDIFIKMNCGHEMHYSCYNIHIKNKYNLCPFCKIDSIDSIDSKETTNKTFDFKYEINELYYK